MRAKQKVADKHLLVVVGARPNFVKADPVIRALEATDRWCETTLVHTGQHFDKIMSEDLFVDLGIRKPNINLEISGGTHAQQTARVLVAMEDVLMDQQPDMLVVFGDVNSTLAATLAAAKLNIPVAHVEAGLRSNDRTMPEEINRLCTDALSSLLFTTSEDASENLRSEGIASEKIFFVGNVMIDTMFRILKEVTPEQTLSLHGLTPKEYSLVTLHRPVNVDSDEGVRILGEILREMACLMPVVFPVHPRTRKRLNESGVAEWLDQLERVHLIAPQTYRHFLALQSNAAIVLTDSGGVQEETTALGIPCLTLRENTERPITITHGTNRLVGFNRAAVVREARKVLSDPPHSKTCPPLWDGHAAERIVSIIQRQLA